MSGDAAISVSCALGLHHHEEGDATATCTGKRAVRGGTEPCECRCHAPHRRRP